MIYGEIKDIHMYKGLSENLDKAIDFIISGKYKKGEIGKNIIEEDSIFFNCSKVQMTRDKGCEVEYHKRYIDIHIMLEGEEIIGYTSFDECKETMEFNNEKDYAFMQGEMKTEFFMDKNKFLILFPYEPHMALIKVGEAKEIKKVVFKVEA